MSIICIELIFKDLETFQVRVGAKTYTANNPAGLVSVRFDLDNLKFVAVDPGNSPTDFSDDNDFNIKLTLLDPPCYKFTNGIAGDETSIDVDAAFLAETNGPETIAPGGGLTYYQVDTSDFQDFQQNPCCMHPTTKVETPSGVKEIKDIKAGDKVKDIHGRFINVNYNIKFMPTTKFVCVKKDAFGNNCPFEDLKATGEHPLLNNRREVKFKNIVNGNTIVEQELKDEFVYSLCTRRRTYVMMNGVPVCTWAQREWERSRHSKAQKWFKQ